MALVNYNVRISWLQCETFLRTSCIGIPLWKQHRTGNVTIGILYSHRFYCKHRYPLRLFHKSIENRIFFRKQCSSKRFFLSFFLKFFFQKNFIVYLFVHFFRFFYGSSLSDRRGSEYYEFKKTVQKLKVHIGKRRMKNIQWIASSP